MASRSRIDPSQGVKRRFRTGADCGPVVRLLGLQLRISFVWLIVERVAVGLCDLLLAAALYLLFLRLQGGSPAHHLWWSPKTALSSALSASVLVVVRAGLEMNSTRSVFRLSQSLYTEFLSRLASGYSEMQWGQFVERNRSELVNHTIHTASEAAKFYHYCIEIIAAAVVVVIMTIALVYQSEIAAAGLGSAVIAFYAVHRLFIRGRLQTAASDRELSLRELQRNVADLYSSGKEIRTYSNHRFFYDRIREHANAVASGNLRVVLLPHISRILADQGVLLLFLCSVIAVQLQHGSTNRLLPLMVFYFVLSRRLLPLISNISFIAGHMESSYESLKIMDSELSNCLAHRTPAQPVQLPDDGVALEMDHVSFWFYEDTPILKGVTIRMRNGETVVLQGPSGSGKSSLLNLIAGVSEPTRGALRIDRSSVAYVPQEFPLLDDTIRNNLLFGLPEKSDAELMSALSLVKLSECVEKEDLGLDARVGDNGILFSGGERQRMGLARAVLRGATVLLLDEATSALDEGTERQVIENLSSSGMTILAVAHRIQEQSFARRVVRLEGGYLVEDEAQDQQMNVEALTAGIAG
jgi:ABC-type multidrug transport system fused ATPase/permease subunit